MRIVAWLLVAAGLVVTGIGVAAALGQAGSGAQPWGNELSDNFVFIKALPFVLGFGLAVGLVMASTYGAKTRSDGAVRRWSPGTVFGHWVLTLGFVLALPTGMWQYLGRSPSTSSTACTTSAPASSSSPSPRSCRISG